jgi:hypothetical protein
MKSLKRWLKEDYGKVLFAPERADVPQPAEENTKDEEDAWEAFQKHYFGGRDAALVNELPKLLAAKKAGNHADILRVPKLYNYAYRLMSDLPVDLMKSNFNILVEGNKGIIRGGTYTNTKNIVSSWTVDLAALPKLIEDFGGKMYRKNKDSYHILVVADLERSRDSFLMNPDKYADTPRLAGKFSYQREIISYKPVKMLKTVFCNKDEFGGDDRIITQWLMGQISG